MTTLAQLRKAALSHPGTAQRAAGPGGVAFTVDGETFASMSAGKIVELRLTAADVAEVLAAHPTAERAEGASGVRVPVGDINGQRLNHWVRRAWLARAPEPLAARAAAGDTARPGAVGDLPKAIGAPATRALAGAGITTLAGATGLTDAALLALHGVGPRAVRILREAQSR